MARPGPCRWLARVFSDCLKGRQDEEVYVEWCHSTDKEDISRMMVTPVSSTGISPLHRHHYAPAIDNESHVQSQVRWTKANQLVNAAAAWQIRRMMPAEVAILDEVALAKMTTPELAHRFKAFPILTVLRADNEALRQLPLSLLSAGSFAQLTLLERRAIHNVLAERPNGWTEPQLSFYAERERELIAAAAVATVDSSDQYDPLYVVNQSFVHSAYAPEPRDWLV